MAVADPKTRLSIAVVLLLFHFTLGQLSSSTERAALFGLRSSLGLRTRDWPRGADPCRWTGIQCSQLGRVVSVNLSGLRRTRVARQNPRFSVDSLAQLSLLTTFNASGFSLPGPIPEFFGQFSALQVLDLRSCSVNGSIPLFLANLTNLNVLDLSRNSLLGSIPSALANLANLRILNLSSNGLSGFVPGQFGYISGLIELDLSFNSVSGSLPLDLRRLRNLKKLVFRDNLLSGSLQESLLSGLVQIEFVDLSRNNFTGTIQNLSSNFNVSATVFNLSHNQFYGTLSPQLGRLSLVELSDNYFEGTVIGAIRENASLTRNCLRDLSNQRTLEECSLFYASKGLSFDNFGAPNTSQPRMKRTKRFTFILVGVFGGLGFIVLLVLVLVLCLHICRGSVSDQGSRGSGHIAAGSSVAPAGVPVNISSVGEAYKYEQLIHATGSFGDSNLIKHGHSGDLFKGVLEGGITVVIKKIDVSVENESYMVELDLFSRVSHSRLVPLLGHCLEHEKEKLLVYKYMPNGDLSNSLFKKTKQEGDNLLSLDWITRLKIAIGVAEALSYLHYECNPPIVHRDIQASSILLDDKFEVRLGSLSEVHTQEGDTHQTVISKLLRMPQTLQLVTSGSSATCAYDVYCFGKVLLELITGKLGISSMSGDASTNEWMEHTLPYISIYEKDLVRKIVDPSLIVDEDLLEEVWAMAVVAKSCLNPKPSRRPLMRYILKALENPLKVVREDNSSSARLRTTSSRGSWGAALFGSWRQSSFDISSNREGANILKHPGMAGSQRSWRYGAIDHSASNKRLSSDVFPEPAEQPDLERAHGKDLLEENS